LKIKIQYQLTFTYIIVIFLTITLTGILFFPWIRNILLLNVENNLRTQAYSVSKMLGSFAWNERDLLQSSFFFTENFQPKGQFTFKIYDDTGRLIATSGEQDEIGTAIKEEVKEGLMDKTEFKWIEEKKTEKIMHITVSIATWKKTIGMVDVSSSLYEIQNILFVMMKILGLSTLCSVIIVSIIGFLIARTVTEPIKKIKNIAVKISHGDLEQRIEPVKNPPELGELSSTINYMAGQLKTFIDEITGEKNKINAILTNVIDGLIAVDLDRKVIFLNSTAEKELKISNIECTGKSIEEIWPREDVLSIVKRAIQDKSLIQKEIVMGDNPLKIFNFALSHFRDETGENPGIMIVFRDITELRKLENLRSEFFSNVSHELRTPLTIIKGFCITLLDEYPPEYDLWSHSLKTIDEETDRLTRLVNDMLELSRLRSHKITFNIVSGDIKALLLHVIEQFKIHAERYEVNLICELPEDISSISFDPDKMKQVFINLIDNSIKYTPYDGKVTVSAFIEGEKFFVRICDTGPGIAEEEIPHLFERFFRSEKNKEKEIRGTGLGLPIVKEIIEGHRGSIEIKNLNPGLEAIFWLPLK
jgi:PAS domain S-box-containing protein